MAKLTESEVIGIREDYANGLSQYLLSKKYGVSKKSIYRVVNLISYSDCCIPDFYKERLKVRRDKYRTVKARKPVILIGDRDRVGKDTFAEFLKEELEKRRQRVRILHFADALKEILCDMLLINREELEELKNDETNKIIVNANEISYRDLLRRLGNGKMKVYFGKDVWKKLVMKRISFKDYTIIPDFRFPEEYISDSFTIKIEKGDGKSALQGFKWDCKIDNNGTLEDLKQKAKELAEIL